MKQLAPAFRLYVGHDGYKDDIIVPDDALTSQESWENFTADIRRCIEKFKTEFEPIYSAYQEG